MNSSRAGSIASWILQMTAVATIAIALFSVSTPGLAVAQKDSKEKNSHSDEERAHNSSNLKQAFGGMQIDLFFEMGELETMKPGLAGVKYVDVVDVTGKELLHFERSGDAWLIDPDTVLVYKLHKSK